MNFKNKEKKKNKMDILFKVPMIQTIKSHKPNPELHKNPKINKAPPPTRVIKIKKKIDEVVSKIQSSSVTITIVVSQVIESIAESFSNLFLEFDIQSNIIYKLTEEICDKSNADDIFLIIHNDASHDKLPKTYLYFQVEQDTSKFFGQKYIKDLYNSFFVWEFSIKNKINKYNKIDPTKIFYQPMPFYYKSATTPDNILKNDIQYDVGFYGASNDRRINIMKNISNNFKVNAGFGKIGEERNELISNSIILLNLHYYDNCALETCRINEILQYDKIIISELPDKKDSYNKGLYENLIIFIEEIKEDLSNINILIDKINYYLIPENYEKQINSMKEYKLKLHNLSKFFLSKNLLSLKNILSFKKTKFEYDLIENELYCLHLIETPYRMNIFNQQKLVPNFKIFPAVKYTPGWMGTSYSYTNIIWNAKRCNLNSVTVFEDDCRFETNFYDLYNTINEFLKKISNWDIFVGVIANLPENVQVINIYKYKNITFVELDRMLSMVFNIYNNTSYDKILEWDENNTNVDTNTIDQFLKSKKLSIITTYPFHFDCTNTQSTLWGKNLYNEYNNLFKLSLSIMSEKIKKFTGKIQTIE